MALSEKFNISTIGFQFFKEAIIYIFLVDFKLNVSFVYLMSFVLSWLETVYKIKEDNE